MKRVWLTLVICMFGFAGMAGAAEGVVKVFILAGQSNMEGHGHIRTIDDLANAPGGKELLNKLKKPDGTWAVRDDVFMYYNRSRDKVTGPLTVGQGCSEDNIGPELAFGTIMGDYYSQPVLLIKTCWGGKDLYCDFRPPSAGKPAYPIPQKRGKDREIGMYYRKMVDEVRECLVNMDDHFPPLKGLKPEIAGFVWFQGWNEMFAAKEIQEQVYEEYSSNYAHMIADLEKEFHVASLPSVVGEMGANGPGKRPEVRAAQAKVLKQPSLRGKVAFVKTAQFWVPELDTLQAAMKQIAHDEMVKLNGEYARSGARDKDGKPQKATWDEGYAAARRTEAYEKLDDQFNEKGSHWVCHYWGSGRIYSLIGNALAQAMKELAPSPARPLSSPGQPISERSKH